MPTSSSTPSVAIVVPVYNLRRYLAEALESALAQTVPAASVDIVVVDDGSTDGSGELAAQYAPRVRCLRQPNRGLSAARNAALAATDAEFVQLLDADDRLHPEKLAASLAVFAEDPGATLVHTGCAFIDEEGRRLPQRGWSRAEGTVLGELVLGNLINPHAALVRRADVVAAGGFDETLTSLEDWDLWLRITGPSSRWRCVDTALVDYRVRAAGMHQNVARMLENRLRVLEKLYAQPIVPAEVRAQRSQAYQNTWLVAACLFYAASDRTRGAAAFRKAVECRPAMLVEPATLRRVSRWFLPLGFQRESEVVARWRAIARLLQQMIDDLFAAADLSPEIARQRRPTKRAVWSTVARLGRKRAVDGLRALIAAPAGPASGRS